MEDLGLAQRELEDCRATTPAEEWDYLCHRLVRTNCGFDFLDLAAMTALAARHAAWCLAVPPPLPQLQLDWQADTPRISGVGGARALLCDALPFETAAARQAWARYELEQAAAALALLAPSWRAVTLAASDAPPGAVTLTDVEGSNGQPLVFDLGVRKWPVSAIGAYVLTLQADVDAWITAAAAGSGG